MQHAPGADLRPAIDRDMRNKTRSWSDRDVFTDQAKWPDLHIVGKIRLGMNNRCCMNLHSEPPLEAVIGHWSKVICAQSVAFPRLTGDR
jgi:hypothetical protein